MNASALIEPEKAVASSRSADATQPGPCGPGVYEWRFAQTPDPQLPADALLYVGIAPRRMATRTSRQNLRTRIRYHYRGYAEGSTLRLTLGCLLGLELRRAGSGRRPTFGPDGERELSAWMAENAHVSWLQHPEPWLAESELIAQLDLPLNLDQNRGHPFHHYLSGLRASARVRARQLPIT
ncbi:GIY-YIG nuclease family protein [Herbidospora sp. RD11066]